MTIPAKTILITGCSTGIGRATALLLRDRGHRVFATARAPADVEQLRALGLASIQLDLTATESIHHAFYWVMEQCGGRLDALFNNGAFGLPGAVEDLSLTALRSQFEVNVFGTHELTRLVLPVLIAQGSGRIIQNSSVLGFVALKYRGAYVASKFALEGLSDALRLELAGTGVQVVLIEPGPIASQFRKNAYAAFCRYIDSASSRHHATYETMNAKRLASREEDEPFVLLPDAVAQAVRHALESRVPKTHYRITFPTQLFAALKRILPTRALDALLRRV